MRSVKITALILASLICMGSFTACGDKEQTNETTATEISEEVNAVRLTHQNDEMRDITASEIVAEMKIGWNLGNTMDATKGGDFVDDPVAYETAWGNPKTSKQMIDIVNEAGFNVLRLPVTWFEHIGEAPDYKIDEKWLDRVQEIVNYGIDNGMYVILNTHHECLEEGTGKGWFFPDYEHLDQNKEEIAAVWTQIGERFGGYDEHLIFEDLNEPRLVGTKLEWTGGNEEAWDCINQCNAVFVETIRGLGGNNEKRALMIPTYAASSDQKTIDAFVVPDGENLIVSIHAYTPYNFALADNGVTEFDPTDPSDTNEVELVFARVKERFIDKGTPVVIGEFGSRNRFNNEARCGHATYYISKAKEYGLPCVWWDNNAFISGETFGLLTRRELIWHDPEIVEALMKGLE